MKLTATLYFLIVFLNLNNPRVTYLMQISRDKNKNDLQKGSDCIICHFNALGI